MITMYSLAVMPEPRTMSSCSCRGKQRTIHMRARQNISSVAVSRSEWSLDLVKGLARVEQAITSQPSRRGPFRCGGS